MDYKEHTFVELVDSKELDSIIKKHLQDTSIKLKLNFINLKASEYKKIQKPVCNCRHYNCVVTIHAEDPKYLPPHMRAQIDNENCIFVYSHGV